MAVREVEIEALARHLVEGLLARGVIRPKAEPDAMIACVVELMSLNFETEAKLDTEAEQMAEREARQHPGLDFNRLRTLIKQRLADKKNFTI
jgi:hypothetical protein